MPDINIIISPAFDSRGRRQHDRFDAHLCSTGELICCATRQPSLDASRALLAAGHSPTDRINIAWSHQPGAVALTGVIGVAAQFDVMGERFVRRKRSSAEPSHQRSSVHQRAWARPKDIPVK